MVAAPWALRAWKERRRKSLYFEDVSSLFQFHILSYNFSGENKAERQGMKSPVQGTRVHKDGQLEQKRVNPIEACSLVKIIELLLKIEQLVMCLETMTYQLRSMCYYFSIRGKFCLVSNFM